MDKPTIRRTNKPLPFGELSPLEFERLCLWLVEREGYLRAEHFGESGNEQGRDIIAYKPTAAGEHLWYFQCKRYQKIGAATFIAEVDKYNELAAADPADKPVGIVFVTSATLSATARKRVREHCKKQGYEAEFWARTELDALVNKYPDMVEKFFGLPPQITALHQLPTPPADFTGRTAELDELLNKISKGGITISGLRGMGGIGKTALALKIADHLKASYPDAQFYLDLRGTSPQPLSAADAQAHVIRAYHSTARLPEGEAGLSGLYHSVLHNQRVLLLMDNAARGEQITPLIPPASCALIITSRFHFTVPGLYAKDIGILPEEDAHRLLLTIAPRIGVEVKRISELCGRLPLALRLAATALAEQVNLSPKDYVQRLEKASGRLSLVDASLSLSYDLLNEEMQSKWRMLSIFPATFDVKAAASVWGVERDKAADVLGELIKYSLVDYEASSERYSLHDLVRVFAESKLSKVEINESKRRHATHYLIVVSAYDSLYKRGGKYMTAGLAMFDLERSNIEAGQAWAAGAAKDDEVARVLCSLYPETGIYLMMLRLHPRELIRWLEAALQAARLMNDGETEGKHLNHLGLTYGDLGETHKAIECHEQQLVIARKIGNRRLEGGALGNLGLAYSYLDESRKSIEFCEQALVILREINDRRNEGVVLGSLGTAYAYLGEPRKAIDYHEQSLVIRREVNDRQGIGNSLGSLGFDYAALGQMREAIEYYNQHLAIAREIGDQQGIGITLDNLSKALHQLGEHEQAIAAAEFALLIYEQIESPHETKIRERLARWRDSKQE